MGVGAAVIEDHGDLAFLDVKLVVELLQPVGEQVTCHPGSPLGLVVGGKVGHPLKAAWFGEFAQDKGVAFFLSQTYWRKA